MNFYFTYKTICNLNNKYYLGAHSTKDLKDGYLGSGRLLKKSIKEFGRKNHTKEILEFFNNALDLNNAEIRLITSEHLDNPNCLNLMYGGGHAFTNSNFSERVSRGLSKSEKFKKSIKDPSRNLKISEAQKGEKNHRYGKKNSKPHMEAIIKSVSCKKSLEHNKKISESLKGREFSETHRDNIRKQLKDPGGNFLR